MRFFIIDKKKLALEINKFKYSFKNDVLPEVFRGSLTSGVRSHMRRVAVNWFMYLQNLNSTTITSKSKAVIAQLKRHAPNNGV